MITVIGSINLDLIANVERLPGAGETVMGTGFATSPGGKGANQALAARRAGAEVRMVGAVGGDGFAAQALAMLDADGVVLTDVKRVAGSTGTALILVAADGENSIAVVPGANASVSPEDVERAGIERDSYVLLQQEVPLASVEAALRCANEAGATTILNTAPFHRESAKLLPQAAIVIANETEFDLYAADLSLAGTDRTARMGDFVRRTGRILIVTLGSEGVEAATPDGAFRVPSVPIEPVDTVGAGDTFCGYLAAGLSQRLYLRPAIERAARAAALACLTPGAQPAIPLAEQVDGRMAAGG